MDRRPSGPAACTTRQPCPHRGHQRPVRAVPPSQGHGCRIPGPGQTVLRPSPDTAEEPGKDSSAEDITAWERARKRQSSERICVERANVEHKQWRTLQRYLGRREYYDQTHLAIAGLVSDRTAPHSGNHPPVNPPDQHTPTPVSSVRPEFSSRGSSAGRVMGVGGRCWLASWGRCRTRTAPGAVWVVGWPDAVSRASSGRAGPVGGSGVFGLLGRRSGSNRPRRICGVVPAEAIGLASVGRLRSPTRLDHAGHPAFLCRRPRLRALLGARAPNNDSGHLATETSARAGYAARCGAVSAVRHQGRDLALDLRGQRGLAARRWCSAVTRSGQNRRMGFRGVTPMGAGLADWLDTFWSARALFHRAVRWQRRDTGSHDSVQGDLPMRWRILRRRGCGCRCRGCRNRRMHGGGGRLSVQHRCYGVRVRFARSPGSSSPAIGSGC